MTFKFIIQYEDPQRFISLVILLPLSELLLTLGMLCDILRIPVLALSHSIRSLPLSFRLFLTSPSLLSLPL